MANSDTESQDKSVTFLVTRLHRMIMTAPEFTASLSSLPGVFNSVRSLKGGAKGGGGGGTLIVILGTVIAVGGILFYRRKIMRSMKQFVDDVNGAVPVTMESVQEEQRAVQNAGKPRSAATAFGASATEAAAEIKRLGAIAAEKEKLALGQRGVGGAGVKPLDGDFGSSMYHNGRADHVNFHPSLTQKGYDHYGGRGLRPPMYDRWVAQNGGALGPPPSPPRHSKRLTQ